MKVIAVTQRVAIATPHGERRDALDQQWSGFLAACGCVAMPIPNNQHVAEQLLARVPVGGVLLTGGNTLAAYGGDAPERDAMEAWLLAAACERQWPVLGVCRGMQVIQHHWGVPLSRVEGHVTAGHTIDLGGQPASVNSYHDFGATGTAPELTVWGRAGDGVVEAVRHVSHRVMGMMWHPERYAGFRPADVSLVRDWFQA
jgi:gamma-glutamyl-gamma-aminobutyrate hydrolase PuuD